MPPLAQPDVHEWEHLPFPKSLPEFQRLFPDDEACGLYLEGAKWPNGFACPWCHVEREPYRFENRPGVLRCKACRRDVALTAGSVMERRAAGDRFDAIVDGACIRSGFDTCREAIRAVWRFRDLDHWQPTGWPQ